MDYEAKTFNFYEMELVSTLFTQYYIPTQNAAILFPTERHVGLHGNLHDPNPDGDLHHLASG